MYRNLIEKSALGRVAKIGALYDARIDGFVGDSLFTSKFDQDDIDDTDIKETSIELVLDDNLQDKFDKLNIEGELRVSLLSGMVKLSRACGASSYLKQEQKSAKTLRMGLLYQLKTINQEIVIRYHRDKVDLALLEGKSNATHVVIGIDWGAVCSICCEHINRDEKNVSEIKGDISVELLKMRSLLDVSATGDLTHDDISRGQDSNFSFKCYADVSFPDRELPITFNGAVELARSFPSLVKNTNEGRGVPQLYMLLPLEDVAKICKVQLQLQPIYVAINDATINKCAQVIDRITRKRQTLFDIQTNLRSNADYIKEASLKKIDEVSEHFNQEEHRFRNNLRKVLNRARSGEDDVSKLDELLGNEIPEIFTDGTFNSEIKSFEMYTNKIKEIRTYQIKGVNYLKKTEQLPLNYDKKTYVLYKPCNDSSSEAEIKTDQLFLRLRAEHTEVYDFIIVDEETCLEGVWPTHLSAPVIHLYDGQTQVSKDVYKEFKEDLEMCLIHTENPTYDRNPPTKIRNVRLPCPKSFLTNGMCGKIPRLWNCSICKSVVSYETETRLLYCECGYSNPTHAKWRCNGQYHGPTYITYPENIIFQELSYHEDMKEVNILILGETGVGKSTWINSFYNYIKFESISDALKEPKVHHLIPSRFTSFDESGFGKTINIGEFQSNGSDHGQKFSECGETGKAGTQYPCSHLFYVGDNIVRLIDTPGVGDPRGIEKDKENFDNILRHLTYYKKIHAVCILLQPNNSRLNVLFRFCISELLSHLSASVKDNILFCFTHSRATLFRPGNTLPTLNAELRRMNIGLQATVNNYFCFDSESFRFLATKKNGFTYSKLDEESYAHSWKRSVEETHRLFNKVSKLTPHDTRNTVCLNEARRIISAMERPLGEVTKTIEINIKKGEKTNDEIDSCGDDLKLLEGKLKVKGYQVEYVKLNGLPRTVCTHELCVEEVPVGESRVMNTIYKQICHDRCDEIADKLVETTNNPRLRRCKCMKYFGFFGKTDCSVCGHHWNIHRYITHDTKVIETEFLSKTVQGEIGSLTSAKETKDLMKKEIDKKIRELQEEGKTITKIAAKFGAFYKANALVVFNDAYDDYLDMLIEAEKDQKSINRMKAFKKQYASEKEILNKVIQASIEKRIVAGDIMQLLQDLFSLKHMGPTFKDMYNKISINRNANKIGCSERIANMEDRANSGGALTMFKRLYGLFTYG